MMSEEHNNLVLVDSNGKEIIGRWELDGEKLTWVFEEKTYSINTENDLSKQVKIFLKFINKKNSKRKLILKSCLTCMNFQMSSMARDMGRGQRGVCTLHNKGVEICFLCADYAGL